MDWLTHVSQPQQQQINFKKLQKFTLYDQNYISQVNQDAMTFKCVLNCKRMNRMYSTICTIEGDLKMGVINISCRLLDQEHIIHGQWTYQRIQLTRFAFRYNERSYRNIYIRTNPLNGDVIVTLSFMTGPTIIEDDQKFREVITDLCHIVGQQSQMIFNTMLQIIFGREANQPYLKSAIKVNPGFPRYMKVEKLLDKVKTLIATSNFYKIRPDISSAHKNRSFFKKQFQKKYISNPMITQLALAYEIKFNKKYEQSEKKSRQRSNQFIKDYIQLEQKNEIEFAKHLNEGIQQQFKQPIIITQNMENVNYNPDKNIYYIIYPKHSYPAIIKKLTPQEFQHQKAILQAINMKHPNISQHFIPSKPQPQIKNWIFIHYDQQIPLRQYLNQNRKTISLSTKLHIMSQICSVIQYLHKRKIQYFITIDNVFISRGLEVKIRGFQKAYSIIQTSQTKKQLSDPPKYSNLIIKRKDYKIFPYLYLNEKDLDNQKCDILSLGTCLYLILMDKFPFNQFQVELSTDVTPEQWMSHWVVETEYYLSKGGQIVKIIGHLLLKCIDVKSIQNRPYAQWLLVILCQIRTSLNGLY